MEKIQWMGEEAASFSYPNPLPGQSGKALARAPHSLRNQSPCPLQIGCIFHRVELAEYLDFIFSLY